MSEGSVRVIEVQALSGLTVAVAKVAAGMASGFGAHGGTGRCYPVWMEFSQVRKLLCTFFEPLLCLHSDILASTALLCVVQLGLESTFTTCFAHFSCCSNSSVNAFSASRMPRTHKRAML